MAVFGSLLPVLSPALRFAVKIRGAVSPGTFLVIALVASSACAPPPLPSPESAVDAYVEAIQAQDTARLHSLLTSEARVALSENEIGQLLAEDAEELSARAASLESDGRRWSQRVTLFLAKGREAHLIREGEDFSLESYGVLPSRPQSPAEVLALLREAVKGRSYELFVALLSEEGRSEFVGALEALEKSLDGIDSAIVEMRQDRATVELPDGLIIELRKERDGWRVEDLR